jgi:hypothetical protein
MGAFRKKVWGQVKKQRTVAAGRGKIYIFEPEK